MGQDDWDLFTSADPNWANFSDPAFLNAIQPWVHKALNLYQDRLVLINYQNNTNWSKPTNKIVLWNVNHLDAIPQVVVAPLPGHTSNGDIAAFIRDEVGNVIAVMGDAFVSGLHMENTGWGCTHDHHRQEAIDTRAAFTGKNY